MTRSEIIVTDWGDNRRLLSINALMTMVTMLAVTWFKPEEINAKAILLFSTVVSTPLIASRCFAVANDHARLKELLGPATRDQLIATKFVSALSVALFAVNIPGFMLLDPRFLFNLNAGILFLTALCAAALVIQSLPDDCGYVLLLGAFTAMP